MTQTLSPLAELVSAIAGLSDEALLGTVEHLVRSEHEATAQLVALLAEVDARRVYRDEGYSSLFTFCIQRLFLSEHAAYRRIEAARVARRFPLVLERLGEGAVTLTAIGLVAELLTPENHVELLDRVRHQSKRAIELLVAELAPKPDVPPSVRRLPEPSRSDSSRNSGVPAPAPEWVSQTDANAGMQVSSALADGERNAGAPMSSAAAADETKCSNRTEVADSVRTYADNERDGGQVNSSAKFVPDTPPASLGTIGCRPRPRLVPLAPGRYRVQLTISGDTCAKLRRAQDLLRHVVPDGDLATVFDRALTLLVADLERTRMAATSRPRSGGAAVTSRSGSKIATAAPRPDSESAVARSRTASDRVAAAPGTDSEDATARACGAATNRRSRYVSAAVKRAVWARDQARCTFEGPLGRCGETGMLQLHHRVPFAVGGSTDTSNLELRCMSHNAHEADLFFGSRGPVSVGHPVAGEL